MLVQLRYGWAGIISIFRAISLAAAALLLVFGTLSAAPSDEAFDYADYARVLAVYADSAGMVDYSGLQADRSALDRFVESMGEVSTSGLMSWSEPARIAFWINAYNAITLKVIIDHYPIKSSFFSSLVYPDNSIRQIDGVWTEITHPVAGEPRTLNQIEHEVLRSRFSEPRIHMALVCAAMGCPPLRRSPFVADSLDAQLDHQSVRFLADRDKFRIDRRRDKVRLSSIFDWFAEDFIAGYADAGPVDEFKRPVNAVLNFIHGYLDGERRDYLAGGGYEPEFIDYDWTLNEQK